MGFTTDWPSSCKGVTRQRTAGPALDAQHSGPLHISSHHYHDSNLKMPFLATLKQSLAMTSTHGTSSKSQNNEHHDANITQLPDEIFEMIVNKIDRTTDITNLRQSNKRLALLTTHLIAARCPPDRNCLNATESLKILITGSRIPLLNGTITSLTLSAPTWKTSNPLATYGAGLREVHLLRLTTLRLSSMRLAHAIDLIHFLTAHSPTLRNLHFRNVHAPDLPSWRPILVRIAKCHRLQTLELRNLYYSVTVQKQKQKTLTCMLPRSTYGCTSTPPLQEKDPSNPAADDNDDELPAMLREDRDPLVACRLRDIGKLLDAFFTDSGELRKDFSHEQLLAAERNRSWAGAIRKRIFLRVVG
jgi:hypothetical protein